MKSTLHILISVLMALIAAACSRTPAEITDRLNRADALMERRPDSALLILDSISSAAIRSDDIMARYSLLLTQARDKNYINDTSDTLISIAVDHYRYSDDMRISMLAHYYMGRIHENAADYGIALYHQMRSLLLAQSLRDTFRIARAMRSLSDLYTLTSNGDEAQNYALQNYMLIKDRGNIRETLFAHYDLLRSYNNAKEYAKALPDYGPLLTEARKYGDSILVRDILSIWGMSLIGDGHAAKAVPMFEAIDNTTDSLRPFAGYRIWSLAAAGEKDKAEKAINETVNLQNQPLARGRYEYYRRFGSSQQALYALEQYDSLFNITLQWSRDQNLSGALTQVINEEIQTHKRLIRSERTTWIVSIGAASIILILIIIFVISNLRKKQVELISRLETMDRLQTDVANMQSVLDTTRRELLKSEFRIINEYFDKLYYLNDMKSSKEKIANGLVKFIPQMNNDDNALKEMSARADNRLGNIISRFRTQMPNLRNEDYNVFLFSVLGFSHNSMAAFLNVHVSSIYNRKKRIRNQIIERNVPDAGEFLAILGSTSAKTNARPRSIGEG